MSLFTIRTMTRSDLDIAIDWAAAEGWNPGLHDAGCFYAADPQGFLMGWLDDEPIACISVVKYDATFGFLGFYLVRPEYRGQGYGIQLWRAGLNYLHGCTIGLDGVVAQQDNYRQSGFQLAYRNIRFSGRGTGESATSSWPASIVLLSDLPITAIIDYDRPFFPADRTRFLEKWVTQPESVAIGLVNHRQLSGYGVLRPCHQGYKIGPLFADHPVFAARLFATLRGHVPVGQPFYLDVPEVNSAAIALAEKSSLQSVFETARMYTPEIPALPTDRIFGVTTFELG